MNTDDKILITGASGLAGTWLQKALGESGYSRIFLTDTIPSGTGANEFTGSICDASFLDAMIGEIKPAYVFHLAGIVGNKPLDEMLRINAQGTENLFNALRKHRLEKTLTLITSSSSVYGDKGEAPITEDMETAPTGNYGISKAKQEEISLSFFRKHNIPVIVSRAFNNIAPGEKEHMFISRIASQIVQIEKGKLDKLSIGPLHSYRDYLDTRDLVEGYISLMDKGVPGGIYNICSGEAVLIEELFLFLIRNAKVPVPYEVIAYDQTGNIPYQCGSVQKMQALTGWRKKRDIKQTLLEILESFRKRI